MTEYIDPEQAFTVLTKLDFKVRDEGLLISALARPSASFFGRDAYSSIELKAAALMTSLSRNHPLYDGNKRTAWILTVAFLNINGLDLVMSQDQKFDLIQAVAQGEIELDAIARKLEECLERLGVE